MLTSEGSQDRPGHWARSPNPNRLHGRLTYKQAGTLAKKGTSELRFDHGKDSKQKIIKH